MYAYTYIHKYVDVCVHVSVYKSFLVMGNRKAHPLSLMQCISTPTFFPLPTGHLKIYLCACVCMHVSMYL